MNEDLSRFSIPLVTFAVTSRRLVGSFNEPSIELN